MFILLLIVDILIIEALEYKQSCEIHKDSLNLSVHNNIHLLDDIEVWIEVTRESTKSIGDKWITTSNNIDKTFPRFTASYQTYGWYEGYSTGFPTNPLHNEYVPYGCWFWPYGVWAHTKHSNIYINAG